MKDLVYLTMAAGFIVAGCNMKLLRGEPREISFYDICTACEVGESAKERLGPQYATLMQTTHEMKRWIVAHSSVPMAYDESRSSLIWFVPKESMQAEHNSALGYKVQARHIVRFGVQVTLLPDTWEFTDQGMSSLIHELVHELQIQNGLDEHMCVTDLEVMAYRLQYLWESEHGRFSGFIQPPRKDLYKIHGC